jgi:hypothetical protein
VSPAGSSTLSHNDRFVHSSTENDKVSEPDPTKMMNATVSFSMAEGKNLVGRYKDREDVGHAIKKSKQDEGSLLYGSISRAATEGIKSLQSFVVQGMLDDYREPHEENSRGGDEVGIVSDTKSVRISTSFVNYSAKSSSSKSSNSNNQSRTSESRGSSKKTKKTKATPSDKRFQCSKSSEGKKRSKSRTRKAAKQNNSKEQGTGVARGRTKRREGGAISEPT